MGVSACQYVCVVCVHVCVCLSLRVNICVYLSVCVYRMSIMYVYVCVVCTLYCVYIVLCVCVCHCKCIFALVSMVIFQEELPVYKALEGKIEALNEFLQVCQWPE